MTLFFNKTLLLRGQIRAAATTTTTATCEGTAVVEEHEYDHPSLILQQAVRSIEMAVAIQRKIIVVATAATATTTTTTTNNDGQLLVLANALILLGSMKCQLSQYNESIILYREAVAILNDIRVIIQQAATATATKSNKRAVVVVAALKSKKTADDNNSEIDIAAVAADDNDNYHTMMHYQQHAIIIITHQIAHALYLLGKSYHCQYKFIEAFHYYNKSLNLLLKTKKKKKMMKTTITSCSSWTTPLDDTTTTSSGGGGFSIKTITKCMKSKYAFEKLISAYWDDNCVI